MNKEFGSGVGTAAPTAVGGKAAGASTIHSVESSFRHTIPTPTRSAEVSFKTPTITHKFGAENTKNVTFGIPISQDTFRGNESIQGLKIIAKNNGEPAKKPPQNGKFNSGAENSASKHEIHPRSHKQEPSRRYTEFKPNPSYFQPDSFNKGEVKGLKTSYKANTEQGIRGSDKALEQPAIPKVSVTQEAQQLSRVAQEQGVRVDIEQVKKQSQEQRVKGTNLQAKHTENSQALMQDYISEYIKPNARTTENDATVLSSRKNAIAQAEPDSRSIEKTKRDGRIAAKEFNKDVEQAKRVSEAYDAYLKSIGSDSPASQEEGRELSLRALDQQLQRNGVKEAVITAYSTGKEKNTAQPEDIADLLEQPQVEKEEEAIVKIVPQNITTLQGEEAFSEEFLQNEPDVRQIAEQQEVETDFGEETNYQEILDNEAEEPEYILERDEKANEIRKAYALSAAQTIFSANGQQPLLGAQIVSLMPNDDLQPQEVKSQIIQEFLRDDGSYKDVLSTISTAPTMDTLHEVKSVVDTAVENNTAVRVVEVEQKSAPAASEQERDKVLDESVRPIKRTLKQVRPSY